MILTCPSCATSYFVPDDAIGPNGRRVRCQSCGDSWRATSDEPLELTNATETAAAGNVVEFGKREDAPESLAETPAPELPRAFRARAEQQRRLRRAAAHGAVWAGLASGFVALFAAGWLFRVEVVEMYPRAAAAYALVGAPVNPTGLEFEAVSARPSPTNPERVLVSGALRNVRDKEVVAPPVRVALLDEQGAEIGYRIVRIDAAPVLPGKPQGFAVMIDDPAGKAAGVGVDFAPEATAPAPAPAPKASTRRPPMPEKAPAKTAELAAETSGLRPAFAASPLPPIEAVAVQTLDSPPSGALSASHG